MSKYNSVKWRNSLNIWHFRGKKIQGFYPSQDILLFIMRHSSATKIIVKKEFLKKKRDLQKMAKLKFESVLFCLFCDISWPGFDPWRKIFSIYSVKRVKSTVQLHCQKSRFSVWSRVLELLRVALIDSWPLEGRGSPKQPDRASIHVTDIQPRLMIT